MSRNIMTITKWLPLENEEHKNLFAECKQINKSTTDLLTTISKFVQEFRYKSNEEKFESDNNCTTTKNLFLKLEEIVKDIERIVNSSKEIFEKLYVLKPSLAVVKAKYWSETLQKTKIKLSILLEKLVQILMDLSIKYEQNFLHLTIRISKMFNECLEINKNQQLYEDSSIISNTCPPCFYPLEKISIASLLQILSNKRAEICCHKLIDCLLDVYKFYEATEDENLSDTSSVEIYKAIAHHMSPTNKSEESDSKEELKEVKTNQCFKAIEELLANEGSKALEILKLVKEIYPSLLEEDLFVLTSISKNSEISEESKNEIMNFYQMILWVKVGETLEHVILWWGSSPLSSRPPHYSQHLREWINQIIPSAKLPEFVLAALTSLADALGVHVTLTSWDKQFQAALVATKSPYTLQTGQLFSNMLNNLVHLCNQCEVTNDWIIGAPLDELPLVEQIPIYHRLDHSIHTTRLWAMEEAKRQANSWNIDNFFKIVQNDIPSALSQLEDLRMASHIVEIEKGSLGEHVEVCAKMREKLVSEVKENHAKLKEAPKLCVEYLYKICRTYSLAHLQIIFPSSKYWKQVGHKMPEKPSPYVEKYLNEVLTPVLASTIDVNISNTILKIMGECLLDNIYANKIKFSHFGAYQLLTDFGFIGEWIMNCKIIDDKTKGKMIRNEVLLKCEGVGKLLLRSPGEKIKMEDKFQKMEDYSSDTSDNNTQLMPAEMYVPNQEQWLALRAKTNKYFFKVPICNKGTGKK